nr:LexA family transcriptional regulator [Clostridiales bacterium]
MLGYLLSKIRTDRKMSKTRLSELTNINIGHLSHIEKGERVPSHKALREISKALDIPYKNLMHAYDHDLTDDQIKYGAANHVLYNKIPIFGSLLGFTKCDFDTSNADFAIFINDESMSPKFALGSFVLVEQNAPLSNRDYGVFMYNDKILIRRFIIRKNDLVLRAEDPNISDIILVNSDNFYVIGKILLPKN